MRVAPPVVLTEHQKRTLHQWARWPILPEASSAHALSYWPQRASKIWRSPLKLVSATRRPHAGESVS